MKKEESVLYGTVNERDSETRPFTLESIPCSDWTGRQERRWKINETLWTWTYLFKDCNQGKAETKDEWDSTVKEKKQAPAFTDMTWAAELRNQYYLNQNLYLSISFTFTEWIERRREWKTDLLMNRNQYSLYSLPLLNEGGKASYLKNQRL